MRLLLFTHDPRLEPSLISALGGSYSILGVNSAEDVQLLHTSQKTDVLLIDLDSSRSSWTGSLDLLSKLHGSSIPVVAMADQYDRRVALELFRRGVYDCVQKPPSQVELRVILRRAYEHARLLREQSDIHDGLGEASRCDMLIGSSEKAQAVYKLIRRVTNLDAFVLITGESGTGKELVARAIHNLSSRRNAPFVAVSCGAIPDTLIEAELFGHEKGAYTGAQDTHDGYLERAGSGTIFFDEIGELSPNTQVKLLRTLQEREFARLGSTRPIPLAARVLFATHRSLEDMVKQESFRRDLYFRINVMRIHVPALRDRIGDIPVLARYFLRKYAVAYDKPLNDILPSAMDILVNYSWPGNIRELENVIQGAVILTDSDSLTPGDLPLQKSAVRRAAVQSPATNSFDDLLRDYKLRLAHRAIAECHGNKTQAAQNLHISRAYLHRLLRVSGAGHAVGAHTE